MTALASNKRQFKCPVCERTVERQSRRQAYCSTRCRMRAHREKRPAWGGCTGGVTNPHKFDSENNVLQWPKSRWSSCFRRGIIGPGKVIDGELVAGREWQEEISSDGVKSYVSQLAPRALVEGR